MNEKIDEVKRYIKARHYIQANTILNKLSDDLKRLEDLEKFYDSIYTIICNEKSNIINKEDIQELIDGVEQ